MIRYSMMIYGAAANGFIVMVTEETEEYDAQEIERKHCLLSDLEETVSGLLDRYDVETVSTYGLEQPYMQRITEDLSRALIEKYDVTVQFVG